MFVMGGWVTYDGTLAAEGAKVASFPDHRGRVREGRITGLYSLYDKRYMEVVYDCGEKVQLLADSGRYSERMDTSLDVGMIWSERSGARERGAETT